MNRIRVLKILLIIFCLGLSSPAFAQWKTQTITLQPGWNPVFLTVEPDIQDTKEIFKDVPVETAWAWNKRFSSVQFVPNMNTLELVPVQDQPEWLHYYPPGIGTDFQNNLFALQGGKAYLIKLGGTEPVTWTITGKAVVRPINWQIDSFNLVGFNIDTATQISFQDYFTHSPSHTGQAIYKLNASGVWENIADLGTEMIQPGAAYWVYNSSASNYQGPLSVTLEQNGKLDYGRILMEETVKITNATNIDKTVKVSLLKSDSPPTSSTNPVAGDVVLSYLADDRGDGIPGFKDMPDILTINVPAGKERNLRIAIKRPAMVSTSTSPDALFQNLLEVTDNAGSLIAIPVVAKGMNSETSYAGLWVGSAVVNKVNFPSNNSDPGTPVSTASEFQIRLIVHVDSQGQAKLLQHATIMWKDGVLDPATDTVTEPGRYVIVTDPALVRNFKGAKVVNGKQVGRRITSSAFGFKDPVPFTGTFNTPHIYINESDPILLDYNDPLNPFKHKYHPDHDNQAYLQGTALPLLPEGKESYTIKRWIDLDFTATSTEKLEIPGWGDSIVGGKYTERFQGLHKDQLVVAGTFRLKKVINVTTLNDSDNLILNNRGPL